MSLAALTGGGVQEMFTVAGRAHRQVTWPGMLDARHEIAVAELVVRGSRSPRLDDRYRRAALPARRFRANEFSDVPDRMLACEHGDPGTFERRGDAAANDDLNDAVRGWNVE